jgi:hypothetical protein
MKLVLENLRQISLAPGAGISATSSVPRGVTSMARNLPIIDGCNHPLELLYGPNLHSHLTSSMQHIHTGLFPTRIGLQ